MEITAVLDFLETFLAKEDILEEEPMKKHTSLRVGGPAKIFVKIPSEEKLCKLVAFCKEKQIPYFVLGNGSNLLVSDRGYEGVILSLGEEFSQVKAEGTTITAGAGAFLGKAARVALGAGLTGLEFASGIPGTVGGGTVMNAGAYGGDLSQVIRSVRAMKEDGTIEEISGADLEFGYRTSVFKTKPLIILQVVMSLTEGNSEEIESRMKEYARLRQEKQPLEYPSAGSTFKRPEGQFAGKLIMDAGLRGYSLGGAQVAEKHCGFVINKGNATAADVLELMQEVQERVRERFQVELEPEVICLGEF